ncbi:MAG: hypothetical protein U0840_13590 [Gemmataceae bacterium]
MSASPSLPARRIPLVVKLAFTGFMAVLVPFYWITYGPTNFLYYCDVALFFTLAAVWTEIPLLAGMPAAGILVPQLLWVADFLCGLTGLHFLGMTNYMFKDSIPLFSRGLSLFHGWLPFFLVWLVYRLGYDRRSWLGWTVLAWGLILICYFLMPPPPAPVDHPNQPVNINYVYGLKDDAPQTWMPPLAWVALHLVGLPLVLFLPAHLTLARLFGRERGNAEIAQIS